MNGRERLQFLAGKLRENAANPVGAKFDLSSWFDQIDPINPISCGTTACAFGFAALLPEFQAQGLAYAGRKSNWMEPTFEGLTAFRAAMAFFNISEQEASGLFDPESYPLSEHKGAVGELAVASKIDSYLAGDDITPQEPEA